MGFSQESGYVPADIETIMLAIMTGVNEQFGTSYTSETFVGTNFYKFFYALAQELQENEVKTSEIFAKLQQYIALTNERISRPVVTNPGLIEKLADEGFVSSVKPMIEADAGKVHICVDTDDGVHATGTVTITSYANLVSGTDDVVTVGGTAFTAQTGAATLGTATFQAATSNDATATSLAAQINAHATAGALVEATVVGAVVTITAINAGSAGNAIALGYTDNDVNVGATKSGTALTGGDGFFQGDYVGVVGMASTDDALNASRAATANMVGMHTNSDNKAKNMFYAFGKLLSNALNWTNQQYITMPLADDVDTLGEANALFDDKISFVLDDTEFGKRLGLFAAGGKAIVQPYITRNLELDLQSAALTYITGNQPSYSKVQAALLEDELQKVVQSYIDRQWIEAGVVEVTLTADNFVASASINIAEPKALWRIFGEMRQTL